MTITVEPNAIPRVLAAMRRADAALCAHEDRHDFGDAYAAAEVTFRAAEKLLEALLAAT